MGRKRKSDPGTSSEGEKPAKKQKTRSKSVGPPKNGEDRFQRSAPLNFLLTTVHGVPKQHNDFCSIGIKGQLII